MMKIIIASKTHQKIDPNQEFIGHGMANLGGSFFSSIAGSGSFTRSAITYQNGREPNLKLRELLHRLKRRLNFLSTLCEVYPQCKFSRGYHVSCLFHD